MEQQALEPTPIHGIQYFQTADGYHLSGRDGMVDIPLQGLPIPLIEEDYLAAVEAGAPDYDQTGRGIFQALRTNPDCVSAHQYAEILKTAYPHIISEIGGEAIMLDAKEVDTPYLDRKINMLKIMALMEPENPGLSREIGRTLMEKGTRIDALHLAVNAWYSAEKYLGMATRFAPEDTYAAYQHGEAHYVLGHYHQACDIWTGLIEKLKADEQAQLKLRIEAIQQASLPKVPPVDYLTAISVALEHRNTDAYETVAIIEDVLADEVFCNQFPMSSIRNYLADCYLELNLPDKADAARGRSC